MTLANKINTIIAGTFPFLEKWYKAYKLRECHVSYGDDYPDKIFYVIGSNDLDGGLWWLVNKVIMHIAYAEAMGWIPVVDFKNYKTQYSSNDNENIWERFFKQPYGYGLSDIVNAKNIIINKLAPSPSPKYMMGQNEFYDNPQRLSYFRDIAIRNIKYSDEAIKYLYSIKSKIFGKKKNIVGVLCRGTDYVFLHPSGHPIQPTSEMVIKDVKKVMLDYHCEDIFLATEDVDILDDFRSVFGHHLLYIEQDRYSVNDLTNSGLLSDAKKAKIPNLDRITSGLQYMSAIWLLTQCKCFVSGRTGGAKGVLLMSNHFDYKKIYDLGLYS